MLSKHRTLKMLSSDYLSTQCKTRLDLFWGGETKLLISGVWDDLVVLGAHRDPSICGKYYTCKCL